MGSDEAGVLHQIWIVQVNTKYEANMPNQEMIWERIGNREVDFQDLMFIFWETR